VGEAEEAEQAEAEEAEVVVTSILA